MNYFITIKPMSSINKIQTKRKSQIQSMEINLKNLIFILLEARWSSSDEAFFFLDQFLSEIKSVRPIFRSNNRDVWNHQQMFECVVLRLDGRLEIFFLRPLLGGTCYSFDNWFLKPQTLREFFKKTIPNI